MTPRPYGALALKTLVALGLGAALVAGPRTNLALVLLVVIGVLAFDVHNLFSLKNFLLAYTVMIFAVGGAYLHLTGQPIYRDMVLYTVAFLVAYAIASLPAARAGDRLARSRPPAGKGPVNLFALEHALIALVGLNLAYLAFQFLRFGVVGYYQGAGLLNEALTYGKASTAGGAEQIVTFGLSYTAIALVILYVQACFETSTPIRYRYPAALFVALPVLSLSRFQAVLGAVTLLAIFACDRRMATRRPAAPRADSPAPPPPRVSRAALIVLALVGAVAMAAFVASIRGGFTNKSGTTGHAADGLAIFTSELSPVQAYSDITSNIAILGHPDGRTIVLPLVLQVVPRSWYPNKPLNSGAYYMSKVRPAEWAAGYALPPTFWGDLYLSFGFGGALVGSAVLGLVAARLDLAYRHAVLRRLPWFLLLFANFYALLRNPLATSLAGIALTLGVWAVGNRVFRARARAQAQVPLLATP